MTRLGFRFLLIAGIGSCLGFCVSSADTIFPLPHSQKQVLRLGLKQQAFSEVAIRDAHAAMEVWGTNLALKATASISAVDTIVLLDRNAMEKAIRNGEIDLAILSALDFIGLKETCDLEPAFVPSVHDRILQEFVLVVHRKSNVTQVGQLQDTAILLESGGRGVIVEMWLDTVLYRDGHRQCRDFFRTVKSVDKPSQAVMPVFFGQADACVTTLSAFQTTFELNPQIGRDLMVLKKSPPMLRGVLCFRQGFDEKAKSEVMRVLSRLHEDIEGQQMLMVLHEEKLERFHPDFLASTKALWDEYRTLEAAANKLTATKETP